MGRSGRSQAGGRVRELVSLLFAVVEPSPGPGPSARADPPSRGVPFPSMLPFAGDARGTRDPLARGSGRPREPNRREGE